MPGSQPHRHRTSTAAAASSAAHIHASTGSAPPGPPSPPGQSPPCPPPCPHPSTPTSLARGASPISFYTGTQAELLYSLGAAVTKNTYTTEAPISVPASSTLPHCIVPGNFFSAVPNGIGRVLWLHAQGTIANTSAATFQGRIGWDTTQGTIANPVTYWPTLAPTASTTCLWNLDVWYTCQQVGSAGVTLQVNGEFRQSVVATGTLSTAPQSVMFQTSLTGINAEVASYIELFGTWSASSASNTTTLQQMELVGWN